MNWKDHLEEDIQPTLVFLPGESHGQRSLAGYSPWGHRETLSLFSLIPRAKWVTGREGPLLSPSAGECMMESPSALRRTILFSRVCDGEVRTEAQTELLHFSLSIFWIMTRWKSIKRQCMENFTYINQSC